MLLQQFQKHVKENFPQLSANNCKLLLAVSGGVDSVVMTDLFYKSEVDFTIAHCNFQLREDESNRDELFVRTLAQQYNKKIFVEKFDTKKYAEKNNLSIQESARELRYNWFDDIINIESENLNFLCTAHNADDNIETLLLFLFRGTGLHGLTGIPSIDKKRKIIRPLLFASKKQIINYAQENNLKWVEDSSNSSGKYTRNFFRLNIIPAIEEHFPKAKENLLENISRFKETEQLYNYAIDLHKKKLLEYKGNEIHIAILKLQKIKPFDTILWEIIKDFNFHPAQIDEVKKLFAADNSKYVSSSTHRIIKNRNWLMIAENDIKKSLFVLIEERTKQVDFKNGVLQFEKNLAVNYKLQTTNTIAQLDLNQIEFPLILRKWKQGDYFYPLGMKKKKKLSRFFIDQKLSATEKENIWVIEMNKKIIWIINYRIDDRFKISYSTKEILKISFDITAKS